MVHISLLPPTLSSRVTSVWSPRLAAWPLPSSVYCLPSSYTSANGWKWETSCLRIGAGFLELKLLTHDHSPKPLFYCLRTTERDNPPLIFWAGWSWWSWFESPLCKPSGWHLKLLPMSETVIWSPSQEAGDLESSSWPNQPRKQASGAGLFRITNLQSWKGS